MDYEIFLRQFGYLALFAGTVLEGETFLFLAGLAAYQGFLSLEGVLAIAYLGTLIGDQIPFFLGRFKGQAFLRKRPGLKRKCERVFHALSRHKMKVLLFYRFVYGLRGITPFVFGLTSIRARHFVLVNLVVALIWTMLVGSGGYYLGRFLEGWGIKFKTVQIVVAAAIMLLLAAFLAAKRKRIEED
ncbi:MAG: DedA family protein [Thermodesulfobacteriota bacterium]